MKKQRVIYHEGISHENGDPSKPGIYVDNRRHPAIRAVFISYPNQIREGHVQRQGQHMEEDDFFQRPEESFDDYVDRRWQARFLD